MFSPPPPYPDELNYQFDSNVNSFEEEHKPFVPHLSIQNMNNLSQSKQNLSHHHHHHNPHHHSHHSHLHYQISNNHLQQQQQQQQTNKYLKEISDQMDYAIEYATPIHQSWQGEPQNGKQANRIFSVLVSFP
jgi:hypothetical protein